jgi:hypothetical protein
MGKLIFIREKRNFCVFFQVNFFFQNEKREEYELIAMETEPERAIVLHLYIIWNVAVPGLNKLDAMNMRFR